MTTTMPASLGRARELVSPALRRAAERLSPEIWPVVAYHFGWTESEEISGKAVRPALALLSAEAAGAPAETGLDGAVAVELVHNFSLLHDDVMDRDDERHHRQTAWRVFGEPRATLAGDALVTLSVRVLLDPPSEPRTKAAALLTAATAKMIDGQAHDIALETRLDVSIDESIAVHEAKTAALLACSSSIGAVLAGAGDDVGGALYDYGEHVGIAFQAVDDQLGIWGRPEVTGKPAWNDIRQRKKSLPIAAALEQDGTDADRLRELLGKPELGEAEVAEAAELVERCGGRRYAAAEAERRLALALQALERTPIEPGARAELAELARFIIDRDF